MPRSLGFLQRRDEVDQGAIVDAPTALRRRDGTQQNNVPVGELLALVKEKVSSRSAEL